MEEVTVEAEVICSDQDLDTRDIEITLDLFYDQDVQLDTVINPEVVIIPEGSGNASFEVTIRSNMNTLAGDHSIDLGGSYRYLPAGGSGDFGSLILTVHVDEYEEAEFRISDEEVTIDPLTNVGSLDIEVDNDGNAMADLTLDFEEYDRDVLKITPTSFLLGLSPYHTYVDTVTFEALESDREWVETVSIVLYNDDDGTEFQRDSFEVYNTPYEDPDGPVEANIAIGVDDAYYIIWKESDLFGFEIGVSGTTSGCEELHLFMGMVGMEDEYTEEVNLLAKEEMDFSIDGPVPDHEVRFNTRVLFTDTSGTGDWSSFEYIQQIVYSGSEEELDRAYAEFITSVGDDVSILVKAFPDRRDDDLFSDHIEVVWISQGDRTQLDDMEPGGEDEPLEQTQDDRSNVYLFAGIGVAVAALVLTMVFLFIRRKTLGV